MKWRIKCSTITQLLAIVRTELDSVFYQEFEYDAAAPSIATANTGMIFKPRQTEHAQYIEEVFKGGGLWAKVGETQTVPSQTPQVANKLTTSVLDFADGREISKDLFDDNLRSFLGRSIQYSFV